MQTDYIKFLASNTGTDISKWNLDEIFGELKNKHDINKTFFNHVQQLAPVAVKEKKVIKIPRVKDSILNGNKIISKLEAQMHLAQKKCERYCEKISEIQAEMVVRSKKINKMKDNPVACIEDQIREVVSAGFWENPIIEGKYLYFNTKNDVIMHHTREGMGKQDKNLGKYGISINLSNLSIRLLVYENNIVSSTLIDYISIHPYAFYRQDLCFGSAYNILGKLKSNLELAKIMTLVASLLTTFDDDSSPVSNLSHFTHALDYSKYVKKYGHVEACMHPDVLKKYNTKKKVVKKKKINK